MRELVTTQHRSEERLRRLAGLLTVDRACDLNRLGQGPVRDARLRRFNYSQDCSLLCRQRADDGQFVVTRSQIGEGFFNHRDTQIKTGCARC